MERPEIEHTSDQDLKHQLNLAPTSGQNLELLSAERLSFSLSPILSGSSPLPPIFSQGGPL